jgi:hypothetical protein
MRRRISAALLVLACLLAGHAPNARAALLGDAGVPYSAERTVTVNGRSYTGMVFHIPGHDRHEQDIQGIAEIVLLDAATSHGWLVLPDLKSYVEFAFPPLLAELGAASLRRTPMGGETVNGVPTTKYRIDHTAADGMQAKGFAWISSDGVLMRLAGTVLRPGATRPTAIRMELDDLRLARQDPALFALPPGLVKLPDAALAPLLGGKSG